MTNKDQQLIDDAKAVGLVMTSYHPSLEGVETTYRQYTFSESQLKKIAELIKARVVADMQSESNRDGWVNVPVKPTNLYQYEIMDRTHVIRELISSALLDNAGITPEQIKLAEKALESLGELYQDAGNNFKDK